MCGISAVISLSPKPLDPAITGPRNADDSASAASSPLNKSLDAIEHRGPDARKTWLSGDGRVALGHVRLAINDLSTDGEQPFHSSNGEVHAVVNGELYDADSIRERLIKESGAQFKGKSDCEIVIALYETHGLSFVEHLRGEFAICLYDSRLKIFIAARDRYGIKPLYFTEINGQLLVAAEMKAFEPLGWKPEWDVNSMKERGWSHDQRTMFLGVKKIRPGCYFTCDATGHLDHQPYWDLSYPDKHVVDMRSEEELIAGVRERLLEAVRVRLRADVPVGVFLSGGIDSSIVAGMVKHLMMEKGEQSGNVEQLENIHCYSIGFDGDSGFDESEIAKRTAESLGVQFHKTSITEQALADNFEAATWHCEQALPDLNFVGKYILSDAPRAHGVKVVLTGEGADEHFIGYPAFLPDFLAETDHSWPGNNLPESDREALWQEAKKVSQHMFAVKEADKGTTLASRQVNNVTTIFTMGASANHIFRPWTNQFGECHHQQAIANNVNGIARSLMANSWHPVHTAEYLWTKGYLGNAILTSLADRVEMAHSLEARPPFLDHHLTEYANQLPPSVKMRYNPESRKCTEKWILREAGKPFITQELYERRKHPFSAPPSWPVGGPLHKLMAKLVNRENIEQLGYIEWDVVKDEVRKAFEEKDASSFRMTILLAQYIVLGQKFRVKQATPV